MVFTFAGEPHCPRDPVCDSLCRSSGTNRDSARAVQPSVLQPRAERTLHWSGRRRIARGQRGRELGVRGGRGLNGREESGGQRRAGLTCQEQAAGPGAAAGVATGWVARSDQSAARPREPVAGAELPVLPGEL